LSVQAPDTTLPLEERKVGGLGIFLARHVTDNILYQSVPGGNRLTIVKHITLQQRS
jgi:anti-sigma regulatory factor (Ser/Thr protein kinase)